jgi:hypothetical protein
MLLKNTMRHVVRERDGNGRRAKKIQANYHNFRLIPVIFITLVIYGIAIVALLTVPCYTNLCPPI